MKVPCILVIMILMTASKVYGWQGMDIEVLLTEIEQLSNRVLDASQDAVEASSVEGAKNKAKEVFAIIWGIHVPPGATNAGKAIPVHGWKTRWQVDISKYDKSFADRLGTIASREGEVQDTGIMGRGRAARRILQEALKDETMSEPQRAHIEAVIASLNNVIGWMEMDDGVTKGERQPRVDLTREWDSPSAFWQSTADTGWIAEVYAQAINIMKAEYQGDLQDAQLHARGMRDLALKVLEGVDASGDGIVQPVKMEGGIMAALAEARMAGLVRTSTVQAQF